MQQLNQPELAYLIGLCITRGYFSDSKIIVDFTYKKESFKLPPGCSIDLSKKDREYTVDGTQVTDLLKRYLQTEIEVKRDNQKYSMIIKIPHGSLVSQTLNNILGPLEFFSYKTSYIPDIIWNSSIDIQKYFMRGVADACSSPTYADRDPRKRTRICIDIPFENWKLPINICRLLQENLNTPVSNILWGHPNLRTSNKPQWHSWPKEHRIRLFSTEFEEIGFGFEFKQNILMRFIEYDQKVTSSFCWPDKKSRRATNRPSHSDEQSERIPLEARKHICNFREICSAMGCKQKEKRNERI